MAIPDVHANECVEKNAIPVVFDKVSDCLYLAVSKEDNRRIVRRIDLCLLPFMVRNEH